jgi:hypothetical protein
MDLGAIMARAVFIEIVCIAGAAFALGIGFTAAFYFLFRGVVSG